MRLFQSLALKILIFMATAFAATALFAFLLVNIEVKQLIDISQRHVYEEKIEAVLGMLSSQERRLEATGMREAYKKDFKDSILATIRQVQPKSPDVDIFLYILDKSSGVVLLPRLAGGAASPASAVDVHRIITAGSGEFDYLGGDRKKRWNIFRSFPEWGWIVGYSVPLKAKYADARSLREKLFQVMILTAALVFLLLFVIITMLTRPIVQLTKASSEMAAGKLDLEIDTGGRDEVGTLARSLANLRDAIRQKINDLGRKNEDLLSEIAHRKQVEAALQESEALYRSLIENIDLGIVLIDTDFTVIMANKALGKLFNKDPRALIGKKCHRELKKRKQLCAHCPGKIAMATGKPQELDAKGVRDDGSTFLVMSKAFPVMDQDGTSHGFIEVLEDITLRRKMEQEIQKAQKLESLEILAGGLAHDFNNMLTSIIVNISLARNCLENKNEIIKLLEATEKSSLRARGLTQQLLTLSKGGAPVTTPTSISKIILESANFTLSGTNVDCRYTVPPDLWPVIANADQFSQVIQNLVNNAVQAMPRGGTIRIGAENIRVGRNDRLPLKIGKYAKISIADHGPGIPPENISQVFDPFFTTRERGNGLGLTICHSIIKKHSGHIDVKSRVGQGTTIEVYLPASGKKPVKRKEKEVSSPRAGKILVFDDDEQVREAVSGALTFLGYKVHLAVNGFDTIEIYRESMEAGEPFDAVIMDLTVPGGPGGKEVIELLKQLDPRAKAIVSSGYSNDPIMADFKKYGFIGVLPKPYSSKELEMALRMVLG